MSLSLRWGTLRAEGLDCVIGWRRASLLSLGGTSLLLLDLVLLRGVGEEQGKESKGVVVSMLTRALR